MRLIDITVPIRAGMVVFPGDPAVRLERTSSIATGDLANVSRLDFGVHSGTHIDAPVHFREDGYGVDGVALESLVGAADVIDARSVCGNLDAAALDALALPADATRVLFRTANSALWGSPTFSPDYVRLTADAARMLVQSGVRLVGLDYLSIGDGEVHRVLFEAGIVPLEGIDLRDVPAGRYHLICLPLRIAGADGAPARAVLTAT